MTTDLQTTQKIIRTLLLLLLINYTQQLPLPTTLPMQIQPLQSIPLQFKLVLFSVRISQSLKFKFIIFFIFFEKKNEEQQKNVKIKNSILGLSPRSDLI